MTNEHLHQPRYLPVEPSTSAAAPPAERVVFVQPAPRPRGLVDQLFRVAAVIGLLLVVTMLAALLFTVLSVVGVGHRLGGSFDGVGSAVGHVDTRVGGAAQAIADHFDPAHPPRGTLSYDAEFDQLRVVPAGTELARTGDYVYTVSAIKKRDGAGDPNDAAYAVIHRAYIKPHETKLLGRTISEDKGEQDYYVYRGESFSIGQSYYKVNWVSIEQNQTAIARYRDADTLTASLKFQGK